MKSKKLLLECSILEKRKSGSLCFTRYFIGQREIKVSNWNWIKFICVSLSLKGKSVITYIKSTRKEIYHNSIAVFFDS